jgi:4-hydroxybenzoyl-CoA thioesterase
MTAPFIYSRTVAFGECDPARIYFAPRAVDYAVEAVEAWFVEVLGVSWGDLFSSHGLEARFISTDCEYKRPLVAGQVVQVRLAVVTTCQNSFVLSAAGVLGPDEISFRVGLEIGFVDCDSGMFIPIPEKFQELIQSCRTHFMNSDSGAAESSELLVHVPLRTVDEGWLPVSRSGLVPFTRQHRVRYGECGISGKIYPPKLVECAVEAVGEWYESCLGISWLEQCIRKRGTPFLNIRCEYLRPIVLGQTITMVVRIPRLGNTSIGYEVKGYDESGAPCFESQMAACYISEESGSPRSYSFPNDLRSRILAYQGACQGDKDLSTPLN